MNARLHTALRPRNVVRVAFIAGCLFAGFVAAAWAAGAPTQSGAPSITGTMRVGNVITISNGSWTGSPTSFLYQFVRCAAICDPTGGYAPIGPASSTNTYLLAQADAGHQLYGLVQATNASGSTVATAFPTAVIANADGSPSSGTTTTATTTTTPTTTTAPTTTTPTTTTTTAKTTTTAPTTTAPTTSTTTTTTTTKSTGTTSTTSTTTGTTTTKATSASAASTTTNATTSTAADSTTGSTTTTAPTAARHRVHPAPKARIKVSADGRRKESFAATSSHAVAPATKVKSFTWAFGDGKAGKGMHVAHRYVRAGTYKVSLTIRDNLGASAKATLVVRVR